MTVKLCRPSHEPPEPLQLPDTCTVSAPQIDQLERSLPKEVKERMETDSDTSPLAGQSL